jgi:hypothetical protein
MLLKQITIKKIILILSISVFSNTVFADRIKDFADIAGQRPNQLVGYGLVVGLQGTGDGADVSFTAQSMRLGSLFRSLLMLLLALPVLLALQAPRLLLAVQQRSRSPREPPGDPPWAMVASAPPLPSLAQPWPGPSGRANPKGSTVAKAWVNRCNWAALRVKPTCKQPSKPPTSNC